MTTFKTSQKGINLVVHYESIHDSDLTVIGLQPKMDPVGIWSRGYGQAIRVNGKFLKGIENHDLAMTFTLNNEEEAMKLLLIELTPFENQINALGLDINQEQFDALVSFCYNCGFGAFLKSTLLARVKAKAPVKSIELAFLMWNKGGGVVLKGLTYRRQSEATLFNTGNLVFYN